MNTRNFKCFQVVYEERNLQVAAGKLFLSPQGLSKIIKNLEEEVATPLFFRSKEGVVPTESGKIF
jgi:DNA-binding transcriptional LysR family regulator